MFEIIGRIVVYGGLALVAVTGAGALWVFVELLIFSGGVPIRASLGG